MSELRTYRTVNSIVMALLDHRFKLLGKSDEDSLDKIITDFLIDFFKKFEKAYRPKFPDTDNVGEYRDALLLRAAMVLDNSNESWIATYYERLDSQLPGAKLRTNIFSTESSPYDSLISDSLRRIMDEAMPGYTRGYGLLDGKNNILKTYFSEFLYCVHDHTGMHQAILNSPARIMRGVFGQTELQTGNALCHITFTFSRGDKSITFVQDECDEFGLSAGIQSYHSDLPTALAMIEDVTKNYDPEKFKGVVTE